MVYAEEFSPYSYRQNGQLKGILVDIVEEVLVRRLRLSVEHSGYPWTRAQILVQRGEADAFVTVATEERRAYTVPSSEWVTQGRLALFARRNHPKLAQFRGIKGVQDLKGVRIGTYYGNSWAKSKLGAMDMQFAKDRDGALRMLVADRFDLMVDASNPTQYALKALGLEQVVTQLPVTLDTSETYLCVGKHSFLVDYLPRIDRVLRKMKLDKSLELLSTPPL
jgi:polar amino acid transport system substrate-binding protein